MGRLLVRVKSVSAAKKKKKKKKKTLQIRRAILRLYESYPCVEQKQQDSVSVCRVLVVELVAVIVNILQPKMEI